MIWGSPNWAKRRRSSLSVAMLVVAVMGMTSGHLEKASTTTRSTTLALAKGDLVAQHRRCDEPLPADVYWSLPFNMMIKNQQVFVACHKIYGNLKINQK
ncbi:hypothetical protein TELCIR_12324 [Teladorsagia circumcincta]|uniref:Uncharacterized protein n=1 Tax=Teladorsagia circumcincta TaxID=45464 RepID=A0A2G9U706_TELCI|nr:hypothetical protein TELCIR_12324 [Teladorsagia circumcincta]